MKNYMISARIPASLIDELKEVSKKDHYLDLSEAVRSIIRDNWTQNKDPIAFQLKKFREEVSESINKTNQEAVLEELRKIKDSILENLGGRDSGR